MSNNMIGAINFLALLLSIPIIGAGIWLANQPESACINFLHWPVIILGLLVLIVAILGIVGGFWQVKPLLIIYLIAMLIMLILLGALAWFVFTNTSRGSAHPAPNRAYSEYRLDDFSGWLRKRVQGPFKWDRIRNCLSSIGTCADLNQTYHNAQDFFNAPLAPVESGCCKPPTECGYTFINPTNWISPIDTAAGMDCLAWNNDQNQLCYSCDSCKAGLLSTLRKQWRQANLILIATLIALISVFLIACCCTFRTPPKSDDTFRNYKQGHI